jgi:hypothetical protein
MLWDCACVRRVSDAAAEDMVVVGLDKRIAEAWEELENGLRDLRLGFEDASCDGMSCGIQRMLGRWLRNLGVMVGAATLTRREGFGTRKWCGNELEGRDEYVVWRSLCG